MNFFLSTRNEISTSSCRNQAQCSKALVLKILTIRKKIGNEVDDRDSWWNCRAPRCGFDTNQGSRVPFSVNHPPSFASLSLSLSPSHPLSQEADEIWMSRSVLKNDRAVNWSILLTREPRVSNQPRRRQQNADFNKNFMSFMLDVASSKSSTTSEGSERRKFCFLRGAARCTAVRGMLIPRRSTVYWKMALLRSLDVWRIIRA